ncbi:MAG: AAA family ATPase [Gemmatimonadetes bacterium]|nr:AAA family ATPase [Gemmatimonadota bacterium]
MPTSSSDHPPQQLLLPGSQMQSPEPPPYLEEEEGGIDIRRYIAALLRHKWLIAGLGVLGLSAGAALTRVVKPIYEVQATIQIDLMSQSAAAASPIRTDALLQNRGWLELVRSFRVLDEVVRRRQLYLELSTEADRIHFQGFTLMEKFTPGAFRVEVSQAGDRVSIENRDGAVLDQQAVGDSLGKALGFLWVPTGTTPGLSLDFVVRTPRDAAVRLSRALEAPPLGIDDSFLRLSLRGTDPVEITATVNAVAARFVEVGASLKRDKLSQLTEVLKGQLDRSQNDLRVAEDALETFKINTITLPNDRGANPIASGLQETRDPVRTAYFRTRQDRDSLDMERESIQRALLAADSSTSLLVTLGAIPSVRSSVELNDAVSLLAAKRTQAREMRLTFGPAHAPLQQLNREITELERVTVPAQARALIANLAQRVRDLDARITASGREMQAIPARVAEESRRERNVLIANNLYTSLQSAYEQARLAEMSAAPDVRLLDEAKVPLEPVTDQLVIILLGGFAAGIGLGLVLALLLDRFDRRIRYPDQITKDLGLTILGTLPLMKSKKGGAADPDQAAQLLESTRSIRMNLAYAHGTAGTFITTVSSPGPGDGKSFTAANLARAFSAAGRRTLLIDADTRRGLLHRSLGVDRKPGLLDYLRGEAQRSEIIRTMTDLGIDFIPSGTRFAGGPELLASPVMAQFLMGLRGDYQAIIVDSPPLGAGVDALVLASLCGSMVLVLRTGVTDRELAQTRMHDIDRLPIRMLGAILNDVSTHGMYKYYGYTPGYRAEDELDADPAAADTKKSPLRRLTGA